MKTRFSTLLFCLFLSFNLFAQLPDGSIAPNITFTDVDGNTHTLYDVLDEGKSVVFDVMATWCGPCWNYHNTHVLSDLYAEYGPNGTNEIEIFMVESSTSTNEACLYGTAGCSGGTFGDWTVDVDYPIVHITGSNGGSFNSDFNINYFPTLYKVCPNRKIYEVGQPPLGTWENWVNSCNLDATEVVTAPICYQDAESGIDLTIEGGHGSISFSWDNGATTEDLNGVPSGSYSCTITEGQGHSIEVGPFIIDGPSSPLLVNIDNTNHVACAGENNGSVFVSTSGGGTNYSYNWSNGANTEDLMNLSGGLYALSVTDSYGCTETSTVFINEPPAINFTTDAINENCDQTDGVILLFANGGTGSFVYDIGNGPTTSNVINDLSAGNYAATVTDENGCTVISSVIIENEPAPNAEAGSTVSISCNDSNINLDGTGSETGPDINYSWETLDGNIVSGSNTLSPTVDQPGIYTITVLNTQTGCQSFDDVIVEGDLNSPQSDAGEDGTLTCTLSTITLDGSASSQGSQYFYQWFNPEGNEISNELTIDVDQNGAYEFIVTNTDNGCTSTSSTQVTQDIEAPTADAGNGDEITCNTSVVNLDGSASSQGNQFEYSWLDNNNEEVGTDLNVEVDQSGVYELIVTNTENGCTSTSSVTVTQNTNAPTADAGNDDQLTCTTSTLNLDGSASSEGTQFQYQWLNSNDEEIGTEIEVEVDEADTYTLIVTNTENGCISNSVVEITQDTNLPTANAGDDNQITCTNNAVILDGSASSEGSQFEYQWLNSNNDEISTEIEIEVDNSDTYTLIVTNTENGCSSNASTEVTEDVEAPTADAGNDDQLTCIVNTINLNGDASSEGSQFEYQWLNSNDEEIGSEIELEIDQADTYTLIVTNTENGCSSNASVEISQDIETPIVDAGNDGLLNCITLNINLDGSASSDGSQFEYQWLNSNNEEISAEIEVDVDQPDIYTLIITNTETGCTNDDSVEVSQDIEFPIANAGEDDHLTCVINTITLDGTASSQGSQFEYEWLNSAAVTIGLEVQEMVEIYDTYTLIVTNTENGCTASESVDITEDTQAPFANAGNAETLTCITNSITLDGSASSSGAEFEYQWLNESNEDISSNPTADVFQAGTYQIIVSNTENGCTSNAFIEIDQDTESPVSNAGPNGQLDCATSVIELNGSGSSTGSNFEYLWLNSNNTNVGNEISVEVSAAETYTLIVTNLENGCTASSQTEVSASTDFPTVEVATEGILNCINGVVLIDGNGSSQGSNYNYEWINDAGQLISNDISVEVNTPGSYTFLVTNTDNGCSASSNIIIEEDTNTPTVDIINPDILDCVNTSTLLDASNSSANGVLNFIWSDVNGNTIGTDETIDVSMVGTYQLIVTNTNNGCTASSAVEVSASTDIPTAVTDVAGVLNCTNGTVLISGQSSSANGPLNFIWLDQNGMEIGTTSDIEVLNAGAYTLIITDSENGCSASTTALVEASTDTPIAVAETNGTLTCNNNLVSISGSNSSAEGSLSYSWQDANQTEIGTSEVIDISTPGTYTLLITDQDNGCVDQTTIEVLEDIQSPLAIAEVNQALNCNLSELNIDGSGSSTGSNINYQWTTTDGNIVGDMDIQNPLINAPGVYNLLVTNTSNGCTSSSSIEVAQIDLPELTLVSSSDASCFGASNGTATLNTSGGAGPYTYQWSNGVTESSVNNLGAGIYTIIATDAFGCEDQIELVIAQPQDIAIQVDAVNNNVCPNDTQGSISITASGGNGNYVYLWSNGLTTSTINDLESGLYTVLITDQSGCEKTEEIEVSSMDNIAPNVITQDIFVNLDGNGTAVIDASMVDDGTTDNCGIDQFIINQESFDCSHLGQNEIVFEVTDLAGNMTSQTAIVTVVDNLAPAISCIENIVSNSCEGINYTLPSVSDNCSAMEPVLIEGLPSGAQFPEGLTMITYQVEDMAGNIATCSFSITVENTLESTFDFDPVSCFEGSDGNIIALPSGGTPGYTYLWNTGETTQSISDISSGEYSVIITDGVGCQFEEIITITQPSAITISTDNIINEMENGGNGSIEVSVTGGTPTYNYTWTDANGMVVSNEEDLLDAPAGSYTLTVTDINGCSISSETYTIDNIVSTTSLDFEKYIKINPNPTIGKFAVNIELEESMIVQLSVLDVTGRVLLDWNKENVSAKNYQVSLADFPNGVYLARVIVDGEVFVQRVVLSKK